MLQANINAVTTHIRKKLEEKGEKDIERKVLHFFPADTEKLIGMMVRVIGVSWRLFPMQGHTKRLTPNIRIMRRSFR